MFNQVMGTAVGTKFAPPYVNLSVGFLEDTVLFPVELPKYFSDENCKLIKELFKRYMDDGFLPWHSALDLNALKNVLNNLHPTIKFTVELTKFDNFSKTSVINFLHITVLLLENGYVETDIFYKETNTHDYLNYNSHHPNHIKCNIPFNLAKRILVFLSDEQKEALRLKELQKWLLNCGYPESVIDKSFFNAKLQGPANKPANSKNILTLASTYYSNFDMQNIVKTINQKLKQSPNGSIKEIFEETQTVWSLKRPPNLLRLLSMNKKNPRLPQGLYYCNNKSCKLCALYNETMH